MYYGDLMPLSERAKRNFIKKICEFKFYIGLDPTVFIRGSPSSNCRFIIYSNTIL